MIDRRQKDTISLYLKLRFSEENRWKKGNFITEYNMPSSAKTQ